MIFVLDCLRKKNSIIKFTVPGNFFNQEARYSGVPWYNFLSTEAMTT